VGVALLFTLLISKQTHLLQLKWCSRKLGWGRRSP